MKIQISVPQGTYIQVRALDKGLETLKIVIEGKVKDKQG